MAQRRVDHRFSALLLVVTLGLSAGAGAQELEPRSYSNAPVGLNFLVFGYSHLAGGIAADPALPIQNAELTVHGPVVGYAHTFGIAGKSARVDVVVPYGVLSGSADVAGEPRERDVSGFWDPKVRLSVNLFGAPALSPQKFASYRQDWIVGASLQVGVPLGQYDDQRVVNLGTHRWSVKPEVGVSKAMGHFVLDLAAGVTFYTDNDDYPGDRTREQEPIYSIQGHVIYTFASRIWLAIDGTYYEGGATTLDGVRSNSRLSSSRLGVTLSLPVDANDSLKLFAHSGVSVRTGTDFDAVGAAWQHRWSGRPSQE